MIWKVSPLGGAAPFCCLLYFFLFLSVSYTRCSVIIITLTLSSLSTSHPHDPPLSSPTSFPNLLSYLVFLTRLFCTQPQLPVFLIAMADQLPEDNVLLLSLFCSAPFSWCSPGLGACRGVYPPSQKGEINKWNSNAIYWKCWFIQSRELGKRTAMCLDRRINLENVGSIWQGKQVARKGACGRMLTMIDSSACCRDMQCI